MKPGGPFGGPAAAGGAGALGLDEL